MKRHVCKLSMRCILPTHHHMKKILLALIGASLCAACEQRIESPAGGGTDRVVDKDTTIVNPPAGSGEKRESNTTIVTPPAGSTEKKTETNSTTVNTPSGTSSSTTTTKEQ